MSPALVWPTAVALVAVIGWVDFASGTELRVFPLYYAPVSLLAWNAGRGGAVIAALASAGVWLVSNLASGLTYSSLLIWVVNTLVLAFSFALVGLLISTLKAALARERELSRTDPLTSLHNRRAFHEEGSRILALCRRKEHPVTLAYVDLDNFKSVNDTRGHDIGDAVLKRVAGILRTCTRPSDLCARLGGDEFAILLPEADADEATAALERIRNLVADLLASMAVPMSCSLGAVAFTHAPPTLEEMTSAADGRMYAAKAAGKNRLLLDTLSGS